MDETRDNEPPSIISSESEVNDCYLKDIRIECNSEDADRASADMTLLKVEVFTPVNAMGEELPFEKVSLTEWKSNSDVLLPDEVTFVAQFNKPGNIERVHIGKAEIEGFKSKVGSTTIARDFTTNARGGPIWRLTFEIRTYPVKGGKVQLAFADLADSRDLDEAVMTQQEAVRATSEGHEDMPENLNNLGITLSQRFKRTGNLTDVDSAISAFKQAIYLTDEDGLLMPLYLNNLGNSLSNRYDHTGNIHDIIASILAYREAVDVTPQGDASKSEYVNCTANALQKCFDHTKNPFYIKMAILFYARSATDYDGHPDHRLVAAEHWIELSQEHDPSQVLAAYSTAIGLVSQVASLSQTIEIRYRNLIKVSRLSTSAAAVALRLSRPDLALEWLEQGRGLVWSQLNDLRTPLADPFGANYPSIADEVTRVSKALDSAGARRELWFLPTAETSIVRRSFNGYDDKGMTLAHIKLAQEWEQLLAEVRALPGFESFLKPLTHADLIDHLPASGHVIIINVHEDRCDALALRRGVHELCHIPLPDFSYAKAENLRDSLKLHLSASGVRVREDGIVTRGMRREGGSRGVINNILRDLWVLVVKPILDHIGLLEPSSDLSRIWWCATGPLAFLPIHAAGIYGESASLTLPDFVISSYVPTVHTLVDRVKKPRAVNAKNAGIFMVSQPDTPNQRPIPKTTEEVQVIQHLFERKDVRILCLEGAAATVSAGIENMEKYSCVHFACHASQNAVDPLKSGFALHDGQLELSSIIQRQLVGADLAFLSACQTSTGDEELSEEAVHLAAGMLAAGYREVVATMWSIQDQYGPRIAGDFYAKLGQSEKGLSGDGASRALHYATQNLRKILGDSESFLIAWVPYVHFGL